MRPLTEDELKMFFEKLFNYIGDNISLLISRPDGKYCFRLQKERVYYAKEDTLKLAKMIKHEKILSFGCCFGKFTKTKKFRLSVTALDYIAPYAKFKVWVKPHAEQQFLYAHNVLKSGLGRITEGTPTNQGVVVYSMTDLPLGFGVTARSTEECRHAEPVAVVVLHQADVGEYIRDEEHVL